MSGGRRDTTDSRHGGALDQEATAIQIRRVFVIRGLTRIRPCV
jgi:hypothetical protein